MKKINVLHIVEDLDVGGLEELFRIIVTGLNREKYNIFVCCIEEGGQVAQELVESGIKVDILGMKSYHNPFNILKLVKYIKKREIDIIHTHMYFANSFGRIAAILAKTPIMISTAYSNYFEYKKRNILMERFLSGFTDRIIAASDSIKEFTVKQEGIKPDKFKVIHDCASTEKFSKKLDSTSIRKSLGIESGCPVVGCVARLDAVKGHAYLIQAAAKISKRNPKVKFLLVGDGPLRKELEDLTVNLGIKDKVIFAGTRRDIPEMLSAIDIFVLPSALREGCPLSILEAMAMSKPVVASRLGGIPEEVSDGESGILVNPKDPDSLADAIIKLFSDKDMAKSMGLAGRKIFEEKFSKEVMLKKIETLYDDIAKRKLVKRIMFVDIHGNFYGGGQLSLLSILESIDKSQFLPIVVLPYEGEFSERIHALGIETKIIRWGKIRTINIFAVIFSIIRFYLFIKRKKVDLIHVNALRPTFYAGIAAKIAGIPIIWHARDLRATVWIDKMLSSLATYIIAISGIVSQRFPWLSGKNRMSVIYNGIDMDKFKPHLKNSRIMNEFNINKNTLVVGIVGHLEDRKGQKIFLQAASKILNRSSQVKFLIVGKDPDREGLYQTELESLSEKLNIKDNVIFTGYKDNVSETMSIIDIFVCPFKDEAFGRVVIEAMALGKPVVAYNHSALQELIKNGEYGILVTPEDERELTEAILKLLDDPDLRKKLGEAARKSAQERFDLKFTIDRIQQLYEEILYK